MTLYMHIFSSVVHTLANLKTQSSTALVWLYIVELLVNRLGIQATNKADSLALGDSTRFFSLSLLPSYNQILQIHRLTEKLYGEKKVTWLQVSITDFMTENECSSSSQLTDKLWNASEHHFPDMRAAEDNVFFTCCITFLFIATNQNTTRIT